VTVPDLDGDLEGLGPDALKAEIQRLRAAIRDHRDSSGHDLCWHHPDLWNLLPERVDPEVAVPAWPAFMRGCVRYRQSLDEQLPGGPEHAAEYDAERRDRS